MGRSPTDAWCVVICFCGVVTGIERRGEADGVGERTTVSRTRYC